MQTKYKVGDKVRLIKELEYPRGDYEGYCTEGMDEMLGKEVTISRVLPVGFGIERTGFIWDYRLIDNSIEDTLRKDHLKVDFKRISPVYSHVKSGETASQDICDMTKALVTEVIINGTTVIVRAEKDGKQFKAVAKCESTDEFKPETGYYMFIKD